MVRLKAEGSSQECRKWLKHCLVVFPRVKRMRIEIACCYNRVPRNVLGRTRGELTVTRDINAESLLLKGVSDTKLKKKLVKSFVIEINEVMQNIKNKEMKEQIVKSVIVHELMHVERKDILELSKNYHRRKRKRVHSGLENESFERYNELREAEGLPRIKSKLDLDRAVSKVFAEISEKSNLTLSNEKSSSFGTNT